jgi:hypothetical protein
LDRHRYAHQVPLGEECNLEVLPVEVYKACGFQIMYSLVEFFLGVLNGFLTSPSRTTPSQPCELAYFLRSMHAYVLSTIQPQNQPFMLRRLHVL